LWFSIPYLHSSCKIRGLYHQFIKHSGDIRGSQNLKCRSRDLVHTPFDPFSFFTLVSLTFNLRAKFEVCIYSHCGDIRGCQNLKSRSRDLGHAPFGYFFILWFSIPYHQSACKIRGLYHQPFRRY